MSLPNNELDTWTYTAKRPSFELLSLRRACLEVELGSRWIPPAKPLRCAILCTDREKWARWRDSMRDPPLRSQIHEPFVSIVTKKLKKRLFMRCILCLKCSVCKELRDNCGTNLDQAQRYNRINKNPSSQFAPFAAVSFVDFSLSRVRFLSQVQT